MASPQFLINPNSQYFPIWNSTAATSKWGDIVPGELFVAINSCYYGCDTPNFAMSVVMGWRDCWVPYGEFPMDLAYGPGRAHWAINTSRYVFHVRRQCRLFDSAGNIVKYLYAGDSICTNGQSIAGVANPDRLLINGYCRAGVWTYTGDLWADTDINLGSYSTSPTIYGKGF